MPTILSVTTVADRDKLTESNAIPEVQQAIEDNDMSTFLAPAVRLLAAMYSELEDNCQ